MLLGLLTRYKPCSFQSYRRTDVRALSTIVGNSGRIYVPGAILQRHRTNEALNIYKAQSAAESFVVKRVSPEFYELSVKLAAEFGTSRHLRTHVDYNKDERVLVYPYLKGTLLTLIKDNPELHHTQRKKALRQVAEAIQELHHKDWIHIDLKPDNILVDSICDGQEDQSVTKAVLGDFDIAFRLERGTALRTRHPIGNAMWRSPEGQTACGITKASDIYSFGLVCLYTMGAAELLLIDDIYQDLVRYGVTPEEEILSRHFAYFGPVPEALYKRVDDEAGCKLMKGMADMADAFVVDIPERRMLFWTQELGPTAQDILSKMTNLDPAKRATIEQVLAHPWWEEDLKAQRQQIPHDQ